jgi:cytochrome P450
VDELIYAEIAARRESEPGEDVLSLLLAARHEDGSPMSDVELRDELMTLLLAGHETTATTLAWAFAHLARERAPLARAHDEVDRAFGDGPIDPARAAELPYLDAIIRETLRLRPVVPMVGRRLKRPMRIGGYDLPAGTIVAPSIWLSHMNEKTWKEPERFRPERFVEQPKPSPYAFFPFGGGIRRCIGLSFATYEMKIVLATILRALDVQPAPGYQPELVRRGITFAPSEGTPIIVRDRRPGGAPSARR